MSESELTVTHHYYWAASQGWPYPLDVPAYRRLVEDGMDSGEAIDMLMRQAAELDADGDDA